MDGELLFLMMAPSTKGTDKTTEDTDSAKKRYPMDKFMRAFMSWDLKMEMESFSFLK